MVVVPVQGCPLPFVWSSYKDIALVIEVRQPVCWPKNRDTMGQNFGLQTQAGTFFFCK